MELVVNGETFRVGPSVELPPMKPMQILLRFRDAPADPQCVAHILARIRPINIHVAGAHGAASVLNVARAARLTSMRIFVDAECFADLCSAVCAWSLDDWHTMIGCGAQSWAFLLGHALMHTTQDLHFNATMVLCVRPRCAGLLTARDVQDGTIPLVQTRVCVESHGLEVVLTRARGATVESILMTVRSWLSLAHGVVIFKALEARACGEYLERHRTLEECGVDDETPLQIVPAVSI